MAFPLFFRCSTKSALAVFFCPGCRFLKIKHLLKAVSPLAYGHKFIISLPKIYPLLAIVSSSAPVIYPSPSFYADSIFIYRFNRHMTIETRKHIQHQTYLVFSICSIICLATIVVCDHDPSFSNKRGGDHREGSDPSIINGYRPCSEKFLLQSYIGEQYNLLDSNFHGFLAQQLYSGDSTVIIKNPSSVPQISSWQRHLSGEGSHRHIVSLIKLDIPSDFTFPQTKANVNTCEAVVIERLPSGVFADPFELQHLVQHGVFADAAVFGDTNLELPTALSNRSIVEIHMHIGQKLLSRHSSGLKISVEVPLHARYPPLDETGYSRVEIEAPELLMRCRLKKTENEDCFWMSITRDAKSTSIDSVVWQIPCGDMAHAGVVSTVTFVSALVSVLSIVLTAVMYSSLACSPTKKP